MYSAKTSRKHCTKSKYIAQALGLTCEFHIFSIFCFRLTDWKRTRTLVKVSPGLFYISTGFSSCQNFQSLFSSFHLLLTDQRDHPTTRFSTCKSFPCFISKPSNGNWNWRKFWLPPLIRMFSLSLQDMLVPFRIQNLLRSKFLSSGVNWQLDDLLFKPYENSIMKTSLFHSELVKYSTILYESVNRFVALVK